MGENVRYLQSRHWLFLVVCCLITPHALGQENPGDHQETQSSARGPGWRSSISITTEAEFTDLISKHNEEQKDHPEKQIHSYSDYERLSSEFGYPNYTTVLKKLKKIDWDKVCGRKKPLRIKNYIKTEEDLKNLIAKHNEEQKDHPDKQIHSSFDYQRLFKEFGYPAYNRIIIAIGHPIDWDNVCGREKALYSKISIETIDDLKDLVTKHNQKYKNQPSKQIHSSVNYANLAKQFGYPSYNGLSYKFDTIDWDFVCSRYPSTRTFVSYEDFKKAFDEHNSFIRGKKPKYRHPFDSIQAYDQYANEYAFPNLTAAWDFVSKGKKSWVLDLMGRKALLQSQEPEVVFNTVKLNLIDYNYAVDHLKNLRLRVIENEGDYVIRVQSGSVANTAFGLLSYGRLQSTALWADTEVKSLFPAKVKSAANTNGNGNKNSKSDDYDFFSDVIPGFGWLLGSSIKDGQPALLNILFDSVQQSIQDLMGWTEVQFSKLRNWKPSFNQKKPKGSFKKTGNGRKVFRNSDKNEKNESPLKQNNPSDSNGTENSDGNSNHSGPAIGPIAMFALFHSNTPNDPNRLRDIERFEQFVDLLTKYNERNPGRLIYSEETLSLHVGHFQHKMGYRLTEGIVSSFLALGPPGSQGMYAFARLVLTPDIVKNEIKWYEKKHFVKVENLQAILELEIFEFGETKLEAILKKDKRSVDWLFESEKAASIEDLNYLVDDEKVELHDPNVEWTFETIKRKLKDWNEKNPLDSIESTNDWYRKFRKVGLPSFVKLQIILNKEGKKIEELSIKKSNLNNTEIALEAKKMENDFEAFYVRHPWVERQILEGIRTEQDLDAAMAYFENLQEGARETTVETIRQQLDYYHSLSIYQPIVNRTDWAKSNVFWLTPLKDAEKILKEQRLTVADVGIFINNPRTMDEFNIHLDQIYGEGLRPSLSVWLKDTIYRKEKEAISRPQELGKVLRLLESQKKTLQDVGVYLHSPADISSFLYIWGQNFTEITFTSELKKLPQELGVSLAQIEKICADQGYKSIDRIILTREPKYMQFDSVQEFLDTLQDYNDVNPGSLIYSKDTILQYSVKFVQETGYYISTSRVQKLLAKKNHSLKNLKFLALKPQHIKSRIQLVQKRENERYGSLDEAQAEDIFSDVPRGNLLTILQKEGLSEDWLFDGKDPSILPPKNTRKSFFMVLMPNIGPENNHGSNGSNHGISTKSKRSLILNYSQLVEATVQYYLDSHQNGSDLPKLFENPNSVVGEYSKNWEKYLRPRGFPSLNEVPDLFRDPTAVGPDNMAKTWPQLIYEIKFRLLAKKVEVHNQPTGGIKVWLPINTPDDLKRNGKMFGFGNFEENWGTIKQSGHTWQDVFPNLPRIGTSSDLIAAILQINEYHPVIRLDERFLLIDLDKYGLKFGLVDADGASQILDKEKITKKELVYALRHGHSEVFQEKTTVQTDKKTERNGSEVVVNSQPMEKEIHFRKGAPVHWTQIFRKIPFLNSFVDDGLPPEQDGQDALSSNESVVYSNGGPNKPNSSFDMHIVDMNELSEWREGTVPSNEPQLQDFISKFNQTKGNEDKQIMDKASYDAAFGNDPQLSSKALQGKFSVIIDWKKVCSKPQNPGVWIVESIPDDVQNMAPDEIAHQEAKKHGVSHPRFNFKLSPISVDMQGGGPDPYEVYKKSLLEIVADKDINKFRRKLDHGEIFSSQLQKDDHFKAQLIDSIVKIGMSGFATELRSRMKSFDFNDAYLLKMITARSLYHQDYYVLEGFLFLPGIDPNVVDHGNHSILINAILMGDDKVAYLLSKHPKIDLSLFSGEIINRFNPLGAVVLSSNITRREFNAMLDQAEEFQEEIYPGEKFHWQKLFLQNRNNREKIKSMIEIFFDSIGIAGIRPEDLFEGSLLRKFKEMPDLVVKRSFLNSKNQITFSPDLEDTTLILTMIFPPMDEDPKPATKTSVSTTEYVDNESDVDQNHYRKDQPAPLEHSQDQRPAGSTPFFNTRLHPDADANYRGSPKNPIDRFQILELYIEQHNLFIEKGREPTWHYIYDMDTYPLHHAEDPNLDYSEQTIAEIAKSAGRKVEDLFAFKDKYQRLAKEQLSFKVTEDKAQSEEAMEKLFDAFVDYVIAENPDLEDTATHVFKYFAEKTKFPLTYENFEKFCYKVYQIHPTRFLKAAEVFAEFGKIFSPEVMPSFEYIMNNIQMFEQEFKGQRASPLEFAKHIRHEIAVYTVNKAKTLPVVLRDNEIQTEKDNRSNASEGINFYSSIFPFIVIKKGGVIDHWIQSAKSFAHMLKISPTSNVSNTSSDGPDIEQYKKDLEDYKLFQDELMAYNAKARESGKAPIFANDEYNTIFGFDKTLALNVLLERLKLNWFDFSLASIDEHNAKEIYARMYEFLRNILRAGDHTRRHKQFLYDFPDVISLNDFYTNEEIVESLPRIGLLKKIITLAGVAEDETVSKLNQELEKLRFDRSPEKSILFKKVQSAIEENNKLAKEELVSRNPQKSRIILTKGNYALAWNYMMPGTNERFPSKLALSDKMGEDIVGKLFKTNSGPGDDDIDDTDEGLPPEDENQRVKTTKDLKSNGPIDELRQMVSTMKGLDSDDKKEEYFQSHKQRLIELRDVLVKDTSRSAEVIKLLGNMSVEARIVREFKQNAVHEFPKFFLAGMISHLIVATMDKNISAETFVEIIRGLPEEIKTNATFAVGSAAGTTLFDILTPMINRKFQQQYYEEVMRQALLPQKNMTLYAVMKRETSLLKGLARNQIGMLAGTMLNMALRADENMTSEQFFTEVAKSQLSFAVAQATTRGTLRGGAVLLRNALSKVKISARKNIAISTVLFALDLTVQDRIMNWMNREQMNKTLQNQIRKGLKAWVNEMNTNDFQYIAGSMHAYWENIIQSPVDGVTRKYEKLQNEIDENKQFIQAANGGKVHFLLEGPLQSNDQIRINQLWGAYLNESGSAQKQLRDTLEFGIVKKMRDLKQKQKASEGSLDRCLAQKIDQCVKEFTDTVSIVVSSMNELAKSGIRPETYVSATDYVLLPQALDVTSWARLVLGIAYEAKDADQSRWAVQTMVDYVDGAYDARMTPAKYGEIESQEKRILDGFSPVQMMRFKNPLAYINTFVLKVEEADSQKEIDHKAQEEIIAMAYSQKCNLSYGSFKDGFLKSREEIIQDPWYLKEKEKTFQRAMDVYEGAEMIVPTDQISDEQLEQRYDGQQLQGLMQVMRKRNSNRLGKTYVEYVYTVPVTRGLLMQYSKKMACPYSGGASSTW